jgi:hypothetical protein
MADVKQRPNSKAKVDTERCDRQRANPDKEASNWNTPEILVEVEVSMSRWREAEALRDCPSV